MGAASYLGLGLDSDGQNLYLNISEKGAKSWVFLNAINGKQGEMGLRPFLKFGVSIARMQAFDRA